MIFLDSSFGDDGWVLSPTIEEDTGALGASEESIFELDASVAAAAATSELDVDSVLRYLRLRHSLDQFVAIS